MSSDISALEFITEAFRPAVIAWAEAPSSPVRRKRYAGLAVIELYGWLRLGIRVEAFPREFTYELLRHDADILREANEFVASERLLDEAVTRENRRLIDAKEFVPTSFREAHPIEFGEPHEAPTIFSLWCAESRSFARSQSSRTFVELLNLSQDREWTAALERLRHEPFDPDARDDSRASLFEGYLRALQHLDRMADLLGLEGIPTEKWSPRAIMRIEVGLIHNWQLNFRNDVLETRFNQTTRIVEERLRAEAAAEDRELPSGGFVDGVEKLKRRYLLAFDPAPAVAVAVAY